MSIVHGFINQVSPFYNWGPNHLVTQNAANSPGDDEMMGLKPRKGQDLCTKRWEWESALDDFRCFVLKLQKLLRKEMEKKWDEKHLTSSTWKKNEEILMMGRVLGLTTAQVPSSPCPFLDISTGCPNWQIHGCQQQQMGAKNGEISRAKLARKGEKNDSKPCRMPQILDLYPAYHASSGQSLCHSQGCQWSWFKGCPFCYTSL